MSNPTIGTSFPGGLLLAPGRRGDLARKIWILFFALPLLSCGNSQVQPYPAAWPPLVGMSATCEEVAGTYVDPNEVYYEHVQEQNGVIIFKEGPRMTMAWLVFSIDPSPLRLSDRLVARAFSLAFGKDDSLVINYLLNNKLVAARTFAKESWKCGPEGVTVTTLVKTGNVMDKLPNSGRVTQSATLYRVGEQLYVQNTDRTTAKLFHIIPTNYLSVSWMRFPRQPL